MHIQYLYHPEHTAETNHVSYVPSQLLLPSHDIGFSQTISEQGSKKAQGTHRLIVAEHGTFLIIGAHMCWWLQANGKAQQLTS